MAIAKAQPSFGRPLNAMVHPFSAPKPVVVKKVQPAPVVKTQARPPAAPAAPAAPQYTAPAQDYGGYDGSGGGVVWNPGPNYGADLVGAPDFTEANAAYQQNVSLAHDQRRLRVRAALIKLGFQPGSADAAALEGIDPSTADLAQNNSASAMAQLGLKRGTDRADLAAQLADRGLLDSGALRGGENMVQSSYDQGLLGATQDYLNEQNTALGDEASTLATGQQTYSAAKAAAANAAAVNPLFTPTYSGAQDYGETLAPGQGVRPDQTPVLAAPPALARKPVVAPPTRYYTYRPGVGGSKLVLKPGQTLKYAAGKGYYAG